MSKESVVKKRTPKEMMNESKENVNQALEVGLATLGHLKENGKVLEKQNDYLNPLLNAADDGDSKSNLIISTLQANKLTFFICATIFIVIVFFVMKWKHSK